MTDKQKVNAMTKKQPKFDIICILDRSGSMRGLLTDCVGAYNGYIEDQQTAGHKAKVTLVAFDDQYELLLDRAKLADVAELEAAAVPARGGTALNDAIGRTIANAKPDRPTICLIQTDGHENRSVEYTHDQVKAMIEEKRAEGWEFQFTGIGDVDGLQVGTTFGLAANQTATVHSTAAGMRRSRLLRSKATMDFAENLGQ